MEPLELQLENGLLVTVQDRTRHYFGGYYHVMIAATADVPISEALFSSPEEQCSAAELLGRSLRFSRMLEKMAVPQEELETVRGSLMDAFRRNVLPYLSQPDFPARFVTAEFRKALAKSPVRRYADPSDQH